MDDNPFVLVHVVFHVILFVVLHGQRARRGARTSRNRGAPRKIISVRPPDLRVRPIHKVEQRLIRKEIPRNRTTADVAFLN
jgi:hypothetical protein